MLLFFKHGMLNKCGTMFPILSVKMAFELTYFGYTLVITLVNFHSWWFLTPSGALALYYDFCYFI